MLIALVNVITNRLSAPNTGAVLIAHHFVKYVRAIKVIAQFVRRSNE
jgi:hypothetical protein